MGQRLRRVRSSRLHRRSRRDRRSCPGRYLLTLPASPFAPRTDLDELVRLSDSLTGDLVTPPEPGADICPLCHSWRESALDICNSCEVTGQAVGFPLSAPSVITLYSKPSDLRDWLTRYKGRPGDEDDPFEQASFDRVRAILGRHLLEHGTLLAEQVGPVDAVVTVPSGQGRPLPHPLESILSSLDFAAPIESMLVRGPGELDFRRASTDGYVMARQFSTRRVLLVEDVLVTGARLFSAARALIDGGHTIAGALVIARRVNRDWGDCQAMWDRQTAEKFNWARSPRTVATDAQLPAALLAR